MSASSMTLHPGTRSAGLTAALRGVPGVASAFALLVGDLALIGWRSDIEVFKSVVPGFVAMNPLTALALALTGLSLWLLRAETAGVWSMRIGRAYAAVVASLGAVRLVGYFAGWNHGLDTLWFADKLSTGGLENRMSPHAALLCTLLGASLALIDLKTRRGRGPTQGLALAALLITMLALTGYAYDARALYGLAGAEPMALHSVAAFLVLSAGVLAARPQEGIVGALVGNAAGGAMARRMLGDSDAEKLKARMQKSAQRIQSANRELESANKHSAIASSSTSSPRR